MAAAAVSGRMTVCGVLWQVRSASWSSIRAAMPARGWLPLILLPLLRSAHAADRDDLTTQTNHIVFLFFFVALSIYFVATFSYGLWYKCCRKKDDLYPSSTLSRSSPLSGDPERPNATQRKRPPAAAKPAPPPPAVPIKPLTASQEGKPMSVDEFRYVMGRLVKLMVGYVSHPGDHAVRNIGMKPGDVFRSIRPDAPDHSQSMQQIFDDIKNTLFKRLLHRQHPRAHALLKGRGYGDIMAETIIAMLAADEQLDPLLLELTQAMCNWVLGAIGLPDVFICETGNTASGTIVSSPHEAMLGALLAAREKKKAGLAGAGHGRFVAYGTACTALDRACEWADVGRNRAREAKLDADKLDKDIQNDISSGLVPLMVVVSLSAEGTGAVDPLNAIAAVAKKHSLWLHVDASSCGGYWVESSTRPSGCDLNHATSIQVDLAPLGMSRTCMYWCQDRASHSALVSKIKGAGYSSEFGIPGEDRGKAIKVWLAMRLSGVTGLRTALKQTLLRQEELSNAVLELPHLTRFLPPAPHVFTFKMKEEGNPISTQKLGDFINNSGFLTIGRGEVNGEHYLSMSTCFDGARSSDVGESAKALKNLVEKYSFESMSRSNSVSSEQKSDRPDISSSEQPSARVVNPKKASSSPSPSPAASASVSAPISAPSVSPTPTTSAPNVSLPSAPATPATSETRLSKSDTKISKSA